MSLSKKRIAAAVIFAILAVTVAVAIFAFSAQSYDDSADLSSSVTATILSLFPEYNEADETARAEMLSFWDPIFRALGHFSEFFLLAFFTALSLKAFDLGWPSTFSFLVSLLYAVSDEIHQYFVPGRVCDITDILTDALGAFLAVFLIYIVTNRKRNRENKRRMERAKIKLK